MAALFGNETDLVALCRDIHRILKPEGHLIARFPNGDSPFSMVFQNGLGYKQ